MSKKLMGGIFAGAAAIFLGNLAYDMYVQSKSK